MDQRDTEPIRTYVTTLSDISLTNPTQAIKWTPYTEQKYYAWCFDGLQTDFVTYDESYTLVGIKVTGGKGTPDKPYILTGIFDSYANLGKVNDDNKITVADAAEVLRECALLSKNIRTFSDEKKLNADLDFNDKVTVTDASLILNYCAYLSKGTGEKLSCKDYLDSRK